MNKYQKYFIVTLKKIEYHINQLSVRVAGSSQNNLMRVLQSNSVSNQTNYTECSDTIIFMKASC